MKTILTYIVLALFPVLLIGQTTFDSEGDRFFPVSPTAASLAKYSEFPVNKFSGTANVSIPLYSLEEGDLSVPISLNYHTGGIKVADVASWAGLGWALNAGGSITRQINGSIDEGGYHGHSNYGRSEGFFEKGNYWMNQYQYLHGQCRDYYEANDCDGGSNPPNHLCDNMERDRIVDLISLGVYDTKPDVFHLNLPGYTGKFYFNENGDPIVDPYENIIIDVIHNPNLNPVATSSTLDYSRFTYFKVALPDGNKYYFGGMPGVGQIKEALDRTYSYGYAGDPLPSDQTVTSWHLVKIESVNSDYVINFEYAKQKYEDISFSGADSWNANQAVPDIHKRLSVTITEDCRLERIISEHNEVVFSPKQTDRNDLLHQLQIPVNVGFPDYEHPKLINKIECFVNGSCEKKYEFQHSDFPKGAASVFGSSVQEVNGFNSFDFNRPKLDLLIQKSCNSNEGDLKHSFSYETGKKLPSRLSFQQDHWGYHTNSEADKIFPDLHSIDETYIQESDFFQNPTTVVPETTDRSANEDFSGAFMLRTVTYPTGNRKILDTEGNRILKRQLVASSSSLVQEDSNCPSSNQGLCCSNTDPVELSNLSFSTLVTEQNGTINYPTIKAEVIVNNYNCGITGPVRVYGYLVVKKVVNNSEHQVFSSHLELSNISGQSKSIELALGVEDAIYGSSQVQAGWWLPGEVYNVYLYKGSFEGDVESEDLGLRLKLSQRDGTASIYNDIEYEVGGRRVSAIKEVDGQNIVYTTKFKYEDADNKSSGRIIDFPKYIFRYKRKPDWVCPGLYPNNLAWAPPGGSCSANSSGTDFVFRALPSFALTTNAGNSIGYHTVIESKGETEGAGKKITKFHLESTASSENHFPRTWVSEHYNQKIFPKKSKLIGQKIEESIVSESNSLIAKNTYKYEEKDFDLGLHKFLNNQAIWLCNGTSPALLFSFEETLPSSYIQLVQEKSLLDGLETITDYTYRNDKEHVNPIQSIVSRNGSVLQTSNFYYPKDIASSNLIDPDLSGAPVNGMLSRHMLNIMVKSESTGLETKGSKNIFNLQSTSTRILPQRTMALEKDVWVDQSILHYDDNDQFPDRYTSKFYENDIELEWNTPFTSNHGGLLKHQKVVNQKTRFFYNSDRYLNKKIEMDDRSSQYEYDGFKRLQKMTEFGAAGTIKSEVTNTYNIDFTGNNNYIVNEIDYQDGNLLETKQYFRPSGLSLKTERIGYGPNGQDIVTEEHSYDAFKRLVSTDNYQTGITSFEYYPDPLTRLKKETYSDNSSKTFEYGSDGTLNSFSKQIDENGNITTSYSDLLGRPVSSNRTIAGQQATTAYEYFDFGALKRVTTPIGMHYDYLYDNRGRMIEKDLPAQGPTSFVYDTYYRLASITDPNGILQQFAYDAYNRNTTTHVDNNLVNTNFYDKNSSGIYFGKLWKTSERKISDTGYGSFLDSEFELDQYGRSTGEEMDNNVGGQDIVLNSYDKADNLLTSFKNHTGFVGLTTLSTFTYDNSLRAKEEFFKVNNDIQVKISENIYNDKDQLAQMRIRGKVGTVLQNVDYQYNSRGWLTHINEVNEKGLPLLSCTSGGTPCENCGGGKGYRLNLRTDRSEELLIVDLRGGGEQRLELNYPYSKSTIKNLSADIEKWLGENDYAFEKINVESKEDLISINIQGSEFEFNKLTFTKGEENQADIYFDLEDAASFVSDDDEYCDLCHQYGYDCASCPVWELLATCDDCPAFNPTTLESLDCETCDIGGYGVVPIQLELKLNPTSFVSAPDQIVSWEASANVLLKDGFGSNFYPNGMLMKGNPFKATIDETGTTITIELPDYIVSNDNQDKILGEMIEKIEKELKLSFSNFEVEDKLPKEEYTKIASEIGEKIMEQIAPFAKAAAGTVNPLTAGDGAGSGPAVDLFNMELNYQEGHPLTSSPAQYNGNISGMTWQAGTERKQTYGFRYDQLDRLKGGRFADWNAQGAWNTDDKFDTDYFYDLEGNFTRIDRRGALSPCPTGRGGTPAGYQYGKIDVLHFTYNNQDQLTRVRDNSIDYRGFKNGEAYYGYDQTGNLINDSGKAAQFNYNFLNLPTKANFNQGSLEFLYTASGKKLQKKIIESGKNPVIVDYCNNIEYENGALKAIHHSQGRVIPRLEELRYQFQLTDHLGNVRILFEDFNQNGSISKIDNSNPKGGITYIADSDEIMGVYHYYPFGMRMDGEWTDETWNTSYKGRKYDYQYNGKELNEDLGLDWNDYGARWYDATIGRWNAVDPLAEEYYPFSGYNYVMNNPIVLFDPDGRSSESTHLDEDGNYIASFDDGDNGVYEHKSGTTEQDIIANNYFGSGEKGESYTSGGGQKIGGLEVTVSDTPIDKTGVFQEGFTGTAALGIGLTFGIGRIYDTKGNSSIYAELGIAQGFDLSGGIENISHKNVNLPNFDIYEIKGAGFMNNLGGGPGLVGLDESHGGDQSSVNLDTNSFPYGRNYESQSYGLSLGSPIGATQTSSKTWVYGNRK